MINFFLSGIFAQDRPGEKDISYRPPMVSGSFYPSDPKKLRDMLGEFLKSDEQIIDQDIFGLVVPHAGYVYSGSTAGKAYRHLAGKKYDAFIIISPSHHKYFKGASVFSGDAYVTPLGNCLTDKELAKKIASVSDKVKLSLDGHNWRDSSAEHSLEVQIPFLQTISPNTPIVPIVIGSQDDVTINALMGAIVFGVKSLNRKVCIIASSDLSHFHSIDEAKKLDKPVSDAFNAYDYFRLGLLHSSKSIEACGAGPILTMMLASEQLGANKSKTIEYLTSGDTPAGKNNSNRVVGYLSGLVYKSDPDGLRFLPMLNEHEKKLLLSLAKKSVHSRVLGKKYIREITEDLPEVFNEQFTGFVTITKKGQLRACVGHTIPTTKLIDEIEYVAGVAVENDYRFGPVRENELNDLEYEVSILSRFKRITDFNEIKIGRDGLYIRFGNKSGLLLPQVAGERNWDVKTFLEQLSNKAGLAKNAYNDNSAEIYIFQALIIHE